MKPFADRRDRARRVLRAHRHLDAKVMALAVLVDAIFALLGVLSLLSLAAPLLTYSLVVRARYRDVDLKSIIGRVADVLVPEMAMISTQAGETGRRLWSRTVADENVAESIRSCFGVGKRGVLAHVGLFNNPERVEWLECTFGVVLADNRLVTFQRSYGRGALLIAYSAGELFVGGIDNEDTAAACRVLRIINGLEDCSTSFKNEVERTLRVLDRAFLLVIDVSEAEPRLAEAIAPTY